MRNQLSKLDASIASGIAYLAEHQYPSGEFCCYIAADEPMLGWCITDSTVFATMVVASCLLPLAKQPLVDDMVTRASDYVISQMHEGGVWPVFSERHPWQRIVPYDADSLAYASALLADRHLSHLIERSAPLLLDNRNRQGLFYTWFVLHARWPTHPTYRRVAIRELRQPIASFLFWRANECTRADIDLGINSNVLYYLGDTAQTQPIITALIQMIEEGREGNCDKWYRNPYTVYYLLSRAYKRGVTKLAPVISPIVERILKGVQANGQVGHSVLDTAFTITTLLNFGVDLPLLVPAVSFLQSKQRDTGEWPRWLFYYGGPKLLQGWGSEELTTGFCLEALALYRQSQPADS
ncbi:hypothetical protein [Fibrivirga algicola]|uniref:Terpene cyclase/mutase family protein n=1 Tax=Fibrivirga algicola TaxID=2950420 RepID=A0ABX0QB36_9BACT|nr:hypothetical protein [Fibrivirga algicola]NID09519.1 terpene cyclase/mutase family protein [Fibrivirga algicola]